MTRMRFETLISLALETTVSGKYTFTHTVILPTEKCINALVMGYNETSFSVSSVLLFLTLATNLTMNSVAIAEIKMRPFVYT